VPCSGGSDGDVVFGRSERTGNGRGGSNNGSRRGGQLAGRLAAMQCNLFQSNNFWDVSQNIII
jgi:hypothetical protein